MLKLTSAIKSVGLLANSTLPRGVLAERGCPPLGVVLNSDPPQELISNSPISPPHMWDCIVSGVGGLHSIDSPKSIFLSQFHFPSGVLTWVLDKSKNIRRICLMTASTSNGGPGEVWKPHCKMRYLYRDIWKKSISNTQSEACIHILHSIFVFSHFAWPMPSEYYSLIFTRNQMPVFAFECPIISQYFKPPK